MADRRPVNWRGLALSEFLSTALALAFTVAVAAVDTRLFSVPPQGPYILRWLTAFALSRWILSFIDLCRTYPERTLQRTLDDLLRNHPRIRNLVHARFSRAMDRLLQEMANLASDAGERWEPKDRLQTANDVCDGCARISKYVATTTDAPYLPPSETREFYERQAKKLPRMESRRLLVFDIEELVKQLDSRERFDNLKAFHRLHIDHSLQLRYWPYSVDKLNDRLKTIVGTADPLVDFGVVNNEIVFGQALNAADVNRVTGHGRVTTVAREVISYVDAFDSLWRETAKECFPGSQLVVLAKLAEMRYRRRSHTGQTGKAFYDSVLAKIRKPGGKRLIAVDIAPDMGAWWREQVYMGFLETTIKAAKADNACSRMFVFRRRFGTEGDAGLFVRQVVMPQVAAGVDVGMLFIESVLEHDVGVADFILDGAGWGFYLVPGDRFEKDTVSEKLNLVPEEMQKDLEVVHEDLRNVVLRRGKLAQGKSTVEEKDLAAWLLGKVA